MFGTATRLATWDLEMGKLVSVVTIYGIIAVMKKSNEVQILQLCIAFEQNTSAYKICCKSFNFKEAVNMVLHKLQTV